MEKHVVMDWSGVHTQDLKIIFFSIILFTVYAYFLNIICIIGDVIVTGLVFLIVQLGIGMTFTRLYYRFGNHAKTKLTLLDPTTLGTGWTIEKKEIHSVEVSRIFEKFYKSIKKADKKSNDDINDIAWFFVAVWSMMVTLLLVTWEVFYPYCFLSSGVLAGICGFTYYEGRKSGYNGFFEDDVDHLEYYVISRLEGISNLHPGAQPIVSWKRKNDTIVLNDFFVIFEFEQDENLVLRYYLGLPSDEHERIILESDIPVEKIKHIVNDFPGWKTETLGEGLEITNINSNLNLRMRKTFVQTPETPKDLFELLRKVLSIVEL